MDNILHSLPWTLALAMAQAGHAGDLPFPSAEAARAFLESGLTETSEAVVPPAASPSSEESDPA